MYCTDIPLQADRVNADFIGFVLGFFLALPGVFLLGGFILSPVEESSSKVRCYAITECSEAPLNRSSLFGALLWFVRF